MMPHYPYYYDKNGKDLPFERLLEGNQSHKEDYIEYLQYSNKKILELIDHIQRSSPKPPIIILMGDHGFRHFTEPVERKYYFMNLTSVYFPDRNYSFLTDSTSSVNLFREILSSRFSQQFPLLKDSSVYLQD
jgi:phosphoglycerol transferase MdoB-like AlkP superfamily enzyme